MEKLKISVIVPVYNAQKYLNQCIESIIKQSYSNLEIILVDDGSKDGSGKICDDYAKSDNRIKVIHQKNSGVSAARNKGIFVSKGDYITFIDSDDLIHPFYVEYLIENVNENDLTVCKIKMFNDKVDTSLVGSKKVLQLNKDSFIELSKLVLLNTPCCKLYNRDILKKNEIHFDEKISLGEDLLFNLEYLKYVNKIIVLNESLYYYRRGDINTLSTAYNCEFKDITIKMIDEYTAFFEKLISKEEDLEHFDTNRLYMIIDVLQNEFRNKDVSLFKRIHNARCVLKNKYFKDKIKSFKYTKEKLYCFLLSHNMCLFFKIINKIKSVTRRK